MSKEKNGVCQECWGDGVLSKCCVALIVPLKDGRKKCSDCGKYCHEKACSDCEGSGLESWAEEE